MINNQLYRYCTLLTNRETRRDKEQKLWIKVGGDMVPQVESFSDIQSLLVLSKFLTISYHLRPFLIIPEHFRPFLIISGNCFVGSWSTNFNPASRYPDPEFLNKGKERLPGIEKEAADISDPTMTPQWLSVFSFIYKSSTFSYLTKIDSLFYLFYLFTGWFFLFGERSCRLALYPVRPCIHIT